MALEMLRHLGIQSAQARLKDQCRPCLMFPTSLAPRPLMSMLVPTLFLLEKQHPVASFPMLPPTKRLPSSALVALISTDPVTLLRMVASHFKTRPTLPPICPLPQTVIPLRSQAVPQRMATQ